MTNRRRAVITGVGAVTALGLEKEAFWKALCDGRSGISRISRFDTRRHASKIGGEIKDFDPSPWIDRREQRRTDRFAQFAIVASVHAVEDAALDMAAEEPSRVGVVIGSGIGGLSELEEQNERLLTKGADRVSPFLVPKLMVNAAAGLVSIRFGATGPSTAIATACASGTHSVGDAFRVILRDDADVMIAGGAEAALTAIGQAGFCSMKALSTRNDEPERASRPFEKNRDGFIMGEGAGVVVLEELQHALRRGAHIYAELLGYGMSADAHHITAPEPSGRGAANAMIQALRQSGLKPEDIDYVNAHGTSTVLNDAMETRALKTVFGDHARKVAVSSTKSMTGHLLGAAGGVEMAITALSMDRDLIPPTINYEEPDPECDLDYVPNQARACPVGAAMSNTFGFGGHNACLIVAKFAG